MSEGRRFEPAGEQGSSTPPRRQKVTILDAYLAGREALPPDADVPPTALVWLGVDRDAATRQGVDFDHGHRAWLDRAEYWPEFRGALGTLERLHAELGPAGVAGAFAARPQSETPVPLSLLRDHDPWQQELAEIVRRERLAAVAEGGRGTSRYLSLFDAVAGGIARMAAAGLDLDGDGLVARATLVAAHPTEPVSIAVDNARLLGWRLRWAADPEAERALLLAEAIGRRAIDVHDLLAELATSAFAWVAVPSSP